MASRRNPFGLGIRPLRPIGPTVAGNNLVTAGATFNPDYTVDQARLHSGWAGGAEREASIVGGVSGVEDALSQLETKLRNESQYTRTENDIGGSYINPDGSLDVEAQQNALRTALGSEVVQQQNAVRQGIARDSLMTVQALKPLAASGLVDTRMIREALADSVSESLGTIKSRAKAANDTRKIVEAFEGGGLTEDQFVQASGELLKRHGISTMIGIPEFQRMTGIQDDIREAQDQMVAEWEESTGNTGLGTYNPKTRKVELDPEKMQMRRAEQLFRMTEQEMVMDPLEKARKAEQQQLDVNYRLLKNKMQNMYNIQKAEIPRSKEKQRAQLEAQYYAGLNKLNDNYSVRSKELVNKYGSSTGDQAQAQNVAPALNTTVPKGGSRTFRNDADVQTAWDNGDLKPGEVFIKDGKPTYIDNNNNAVIVGQ